MAAPCMGRGRKFAVPGTVLVGGNLHVGRVFLQRASRLVAMQTSDNAESFSSDFLHMSGFED